MYAFDFDVALGEIVNRRVIARFAPREPLQVLPLPVRCVLRTRVAVPGLPVNFAQA